MDYLVVGLLMCMITCVSGSAQIEITLIEDSVDMGCLAAITECQDTHTQIAFGGLPRNAFSPDDLRKKCSSSGYVSCLEEIDKDSCTELQKLDIEGSALAQTYVCSEDGLEQYSRGNEFTPSPWRALQRDYILTEDDLCREKFLSLADIHMANYRVHHSEMEARGEGEEEDRELTDMVKDEKQAYCGSMYSYQRCVEEAAQRHCNETIGTWQQHMTQEYYTPHFNNMGCHIGSGLERVTINAIVIASIVLLSIFALAFVCGVYEKCGEKLASCRRSKNKEENGESMSQRDSVVYPDKNGLPQSAGSRVRFEAES